MTYLALVSECENDRVGRKQWFSNGAGRPLEVQGQVGTALSHPPFHPWLLCLQTTRDMEHWDLDLRITGSTGFLSK